MTDDPYDTRTMGNVIENVLNELDFPSGAINDGNYRERFVHVRVVLKGLLRELRKEEQLVEAKQWLDQTIKDRF